MIEILMEIRIAIEAHHLLKRNRRLWQNVSVVPPFSRLLKNKADIFQWKFYVFSKINPKVNDSFV